MTPDANPIRRLWAAGKPVVNGWLSMPSPLSCEIMAKAGWDGLTVDMQHGTADYSDLLTMLPIIQAGGAAPTVRVAWNDPALIMRALDAGAMGVICPMIEGPDDCAAFVKSCLYPPMGARSFGPIRARVAYGTGYPDAANATILPIAMIETATSLEKIDEILQIEGLGGVYIGPSDLASALGHPPGFDPKIPEVVQAIDTILAACKSAKVPAGIHCGAPAYAQEMIAKGFDLVTISSDARFVEAGARAILAAMHQK